MLTALYYGVPLIEQNQCISGASPETETEVNTHLGGVSGSQLVRQGLRLAVEAGIAGDAPLHLVQASLQRLNLGRLAAALALHTGAEGSERVSLWERV